MSAKFKAGGEMSKVTQEGAVDKAIPGQSQTVEQQVHGVAQQFEYLKVQNPGAQVAAAKPEMQEEDAGEYKEEQGASANPGTKPKEKSDAQAYPTKLYTGPKKKSRKYDQNGRLLCNGMDLCDCLETDCEGCFYPCPSCNSRKCGVKCRCNRKWVYNKIEDESGKLVSTFPFAFPE